MRVHPGLALRLVLVLALVTSSVSARRVRRVAEAEPAAKVESATEAEPVAGTDSSAETQPGSSRQQRFLNIEFPKHVFPYYQRPEYRWPYYNDDGEGALVYGYGDKHLYNYDVYKTFTGYYRR